MARTKARTIPGHTMTGYMVRSRPRRGARWELVTNGVFDERTAEAIARAERRIRKRAQAEPIRVTINFEGER